MIEAKDLTRQYPLEDGRAVDALRGVSLRVDAGEWVAIMGPSGSGKSTLLNLIAGIEDPTSGTVTLLGRALGELDEAARARLRLHEIGFVFQRFHLLPVLSALENVELPIAEAGVGRAERRERAAELLEFVGLGHRLDHRPTQLSGGEQQRVAIARALANRPSLIFADEPTGELDQRTGCDILDLFGRLHTEGATLVTVTHDESVAGAAQRRVELRDGQVMES